MSIQITERNRKLARMHTSPGMLTDIREHSLDRENTADGFPKKPGYKRRTTALT